jgi:hypothetical protein
MPLALLCELLALGSVPRSFIVYVVPIALALLTPHKTHNKGHKQGQAHRHCGYHPRVSCIMRSVVDRLICPTPFLRKGWGT